MAQGLMLYPTTSKSVLTKRPDSVTANQYSQVKINGLNTAPQVAWTLITTDTSEANSTTTLITATAHSAKVGDLIRFTAGTNAQVDAYVASVATNSITLAQALPAAPGTNNFSIYRSVGITADPSGQLIMVGPVAHDGVVAGNPLLIGIEARTSNLTAVANGDLTRVIGDTVGRAVFHPYTLPQLIVTGAVGSDIVNTASTQVIAAGGAGIITYITSVQLTNTSATVTRVDILDGATVKAFAVVGAAAGSSSSIDLVFPVPLRGTANTAWNVQCATTATVTRASMTGYQAAV